MVYITGDIHGEIDIRRLGGDTFPEGKELTKSDCLIIAGDFGLIWSTTEAGAKTESYWLNWLHNQKKFTTLFIDGNHENFNRLDRLPTVEMFGAPVGKVNDSVYHLRRGEVYTIEGRKFFTFGGATSWDRDQRTLNVSYWRREVPSDAEFGHGLKNLAKVGDAVDFIVSHTVPHELIHVLGFSKGATVDPTCGYLTRFVQTATFERMYCGHMHVDRDFGKYSLLYERIVRII